MIEQCDSHNMSRVWFDLVSLDEKPNVKNTCVSDFPLHFHCTSKYVGDKSAPE